MNATIELVRTWEGVDWLDLAVSANAPVAFELYRSLGFVQWGREPEALEHEGRRYDEIYMALRLSERQARMAENEGAAA